MMKYRFQPPLWATILTLIGVLLFVKLSLWQWHRYEYKKTLQESYTTPGFSPNGSIQATIYQHVKVQGHYDSRQFLLDNRIKNNQVGFDVVTPFTLSTGEILLVDRGFVPANVSREILTDITPPARQVSIEGFLTAPEKSFVLGNIIEEKGDWPLKIMRIDPEALSQALNDQNLTSSKIPHNIHLLPKIILLDPKSPYGFVRAWSPPHLWAERSLGYCFQWLSFAVLAIILYVVMNMRKR